VVFCGVNGSVKTPPNTTVQDKNCIFEKKTQIWHQMSQTRKKKEPLGDPIQLRIGPELEARVRYLADQDEMPVVSWIRRELKRGVARYESGQDQIRLPDPSPVMPQVVLSRNQPDAAHGEQMDKA
jgi:hypothetical protein